MMVKNCRSDLAAQIKERLTMDQAARYYGFEPNRAGYICCPFHREKTASLKLYPDGRGWCCFGCHAGGDVIKFVMKLFNLTFSQALVRLNADFGLGLTARRPGPDQEKRAREMRLKARQRREEREVLEAEYRDKTEEYRYWWEIQKYFGPSLIDVEAGYVHPLYVKAMMRLPYLDYWLEENLEKLRG